MKNYKKEFMEKITKLSGYGRISERETFSTCVSIMALCIKILTPYGGKKDYEKLYKLKKELNDDTETIQELMNIVGEALEENSEQDFLGELYMSCGYGGNIGQFFTPYSVANMMSEITFDSKKDGKDYLSYQDPTCGSGVMLIAAYNTVKKAGMIPQKEILLVGQDLDSTVLKMAYIQISLLGAAGYFKVGNTLTDPITGASDLIPNIKDTDEFWFTPGYFTDVWKTRIYEEIHRIISCVKTDSSKEEVKEAV